MRKRFAKWYVANFKNYTRHFNKTILLLLLLILLLVVSIKYGDVKLSWSEIFGTFSGEGSSSTKFILFSLRFPRVFGGLLVGMSFGIGGYIFQKLLHNPLANPNVLGMTSVSSVAAMAVFLFFEASHLFMSAAAVVGSLLTVIIAFWLAKDGDHILQNRFILIGIGIQAMADALISYMMIKADPSDLSTLLQWLSGSLNQIETNQLLVLLIVFLIFSPVLAFLQGDFEQIMLGDEIAQSLGVDVNRIKAILYLISIIYTALATAITGPIAFICFLVGPITDRYFGKTTANFLPAALIGAILVLGADWIGQNVFPVRLPVGVLTGIVGAPVLLVTLINYAKGEIVND
ncbi:MAG: iron ABC transporter permease [Liquorilactobacillus ghanensis]|uniref:FecCD family ABC transporter permease n=1 Tax=Liquorilactobacillus ghanensis TaxID=399370 RepID=UPI0039EBA19B